MSDTVARTTSPSLIHLSDLHIAARPSLRQWNINRFLGHINWTMQRRHKHLPYRLCNAIDLIRALQPKAIVITGDLGQLGLPQELALVRRYLLPLHNAGIPIFITTGNHDYYGGHLCHEYLELRRELSCGITPQDNGIVRFDEFDLLLLDQAVATPPFRSWGCLAENMLDQEIKVNAMAKRPLIAAGHYPLLCPNGAPLHPHIHLKNNSSLIRFLEESGAAAYLCGHIHSKYTLSLNKVCTQYCAGSITAQAGGFFSFHVRGGQWMEQTHLPIPQKP